MPAPQDRSRCKQVLQPAPQGPDEFAQFIRQALVKRNKVIKTAGITVN